MLFIAIAIIASPVHETDSDPQNNREMENNKREQAATQHAMEALSLTSNTKPTPTPTPNWIHCQQQQQPRKSRQKHQRPTRNHPSLPPPPAAAEVAASSKHHDGAAPLSLADQFLLASAKQQQRRQQHPAILAYCRPSMMQHHGRHPNKQAAVLSINTSPVQSRHGIFLQGAEGKVYGLRCRSTQK